MSSLTFSTFWYSICLALGGWLGSGPLFLYVPVKCPEDLVLVLWMNIFLFFLPTPPPPSAHMQASMFTLHGYFLFSGEGS